MAGGVPSAAASSVTTAAGSLRQVALGSGDAVAVTSVGDMNDRGWIVGSVRSADGDVQTVVWRGYEKPVEINAPAAGFQINNRGDVLNVDWYWSRGKTHYLTDPTRDGWASGMNDRGQVFGTFFYPGPHTAFLWQDGRFNEFPPPEGMESGITGVNNRGEVLGAYRDPGTYEVRPFVWRDGVTTFIQVPPGVDVSPVKINDRGEVLLNIGQRPYLWQRGRLVDLLAGRPGVTGEGLDLNNVGDVALSIGGRLAALWRDGRLIPTHLPEAGGWGYYFRGMNDLGDIAGVSTRYIEKDGSWQDRVFLWRSGRLYLSTIQAGWSAGVDDRGRFVGEFRRAYDDSARYVVWLPVRGKAELRIG